MKNVLITAAIVCLEAMIVIACITACSSDDVIDNIYDPFSVSTQGGVTAGSGELSTFTVEIDSTTAEPVDDVAAEYMPEAEDSIEQNSFANVLNITFNNGSAPSVDDVDGVTVSIDGEHVTIDHGATKGLRYVVSGTTQAGSLTIAGTKKYALEMNGVSISNPDSAAINLLSKKRAYIILADGSKNTIADATTSKADHKATFYAKGKLLLSGSGTLNINANYNNGLQTADYIVFRTGNKVNIKAVSGHGIKTNDGVFVNGGIINVETAGAAAKGINSESHIIVNGGRTTVITTGTGAWDTDDNEAKGAAAIKTDSTLTVNGGQLLLRSTGAGGKGIKADGDATINAGTVKVITTGSVYSSGGDTASPKGIKVVGNLNIAGGTVLVRTSGTKAEGIESKAVLTISGGDVEVAAYDDAINSAGDMYITGGSVVAVGTNNDGLDSNGNMYIKGGTAVALGSGGAETGIDIDEQHRLYISGGNIFGIGGRIDAQLGSTTQGIVTTTGSVTAGSTVYVASGTTVLARFTMPPYGYSNGTIMLSASGMTSGSSYTVSLGSTVQTVTASATLSSTQSGGGMPGGGMPGGGGGRPF